MVTNLDASIYPVLRSKTATRSKVPESTLVRPSATSLCSLVDDSIRAVEMTRPPVRTPLGGTGKNITRVQSTRAHDQTLELEQRVPR